MTTQSGHAEAAPMNRKLVLAGSGCAAIVVLLTAYAVWSSNADEAIAFGSPTGPVAVDVGLATAPEGVRAAAPAKLSAEVPSTVSTSGLTEANASQVRDVDGVAHESSPILGRGLFGATLDSSGSSVVTEPPIAERLIAEREAEIKLLIAEFDDNLTNPAIRQLLSAELAVVSEDYKAAVLAKVKRAIRENSR